MMVKLSIWNMAIRHKKKCDGCGNAINYRIDKIFGDLNDIQTL